MGGEADRGKQKLDTKPQIITDEKTNTVRVLIDGKEILTINADGIQINGYVTYVPIKNIPAPKPYPSHDK